MAAEAKGEVGDRDRAISHAIDQVLSDVCGEVAPGQNLRHLSAEDHSSKLSAPRHFAASGSVSLKRSAKSHTPSLRSNVAGSVTLWRTGCARFSYIN